MYSFSYKSYWYYYRPDLVYEGLVLNIYLEKGPYFYFFILLMSVQVQHLRVVFGLVW